MNLHRQLAHVNVDLMFCRLSIIWGWCDECHICTLYLYHRVLLSCTCCTPEGTAGGTCFHPLFPQGCNWNSLEFTVWYKYKVQMWHRWKQTVRETPGTESFLSWADRLRRLNCVQSPWKYQINHWWIFPCNSWMSMGTGIGIGAWRCMTSVADFERRGHGEQGDHCGYKWGGCSVGVPPLFEILLLQPCVMGFWPTFSSWGTTNCQHYRHISW